MTFRTSRFSRRLVLGAVVALATPSLGARAQSARVLDGPRAAGLVGERFDGYAAIRGAASADIQALVDKVNTERRAVYAQRAAATNAPIDAVGKIYAAEIVRSLPPGSWIMGEDGRWVQK